MTLLGVDVSSWQGAVDWARLREAGFAFAFVKCTGGAKYLNPRYGEQVAGARAAGFLVGHYHYDGEPDVMTGTPDEEARWFLGHVDLRAGELVVLDAESRATRDTARYARWRDVVRAATGTTPFFYTFPSFIAEIDAAAWRAIADMPLWLARYWDDGNNTRWPAAPAPWERVVVWQYNGGVPLSGTTFPTDCNVFSGTVEELRAYGKPPDAPPENLPPNSMVFGPYGVHIGGGFREFYDAAVASGYSPLGLFGYPMTEEIVENGLTVQYFERARFEWHENGVQLSRIGAELLEARKS